MSRKKLTHVELLRLCADDYATDEEHDKAEQLQDIASMLEPCKDTSIRSGAHLGVTRSWLQHHKLNGDSVTWGSREALRPPMTVREVEEVAQCAVDAALSEYKDSKEIRILRLKADYVDRAPFCPDHRDKMTGKKCRECAVESLARALLKVRRKLQELHEAQHPTRATELKVDVAYDIQSITATLDMVGIHVDPEEN